MQRLEEGSILTLAPAVYTRHPAPSVTTEYTFVPTTKIIRDIGELGWYPVFAQQQKNRRARKAPYAKHVIHFASDTDDTVNDFKPIIGVHNGHDGLTLLNVFAGVVDIQTGRPYLFPDTVIRSVYLKHRFYNLSDIEEMITAYVAWLPDFVFKRVAKYKTVSLSQNEQVQFAREAYYARWIKGEVPDIVFLANLLQSGSWTTSDTLWDVFETLHRNILDGGIVTGKYTNGRFRRRIVTRKLESITEYLRVNRELWGTMEAAYIRHTEEQE